MSFWGGKNQKLCRKWLIFDKSIFAIVFFFWGGGSLLEKISPCPPWGLLCPSWHYSGTPRLPPIPIYTKIHLMWSLRLNHTLKSGIFPKFYELYMYEKSGGFFFSPSLFLFCFLLQSMSKGHWTCVSFSGVAAGGARGAECHPWQRKICQKSGKRGGKSG